MAAFAAEAAPGLVRTGPLQPAPGPARPRPL